MTPPCSQTNLHDAAMRYARLGLAVLPLRPRQKVPMFMNWPETASRDPEAVERWWKQNPDANVGIATGRKSGCFVFDVDPKNGGQETYEDLIRKHGRFPDTWQQVTGSGGVHLFFRYPAFPVRNAAGLFPGIDIRGDGGQVVAPPSIHPETGRAYEWDGLKEIEQTALAEAPAWLLELLESKSRDQSPHLPVAEKIKHGVQHYTLLALAGMLRRVGLDREEIDVTLQNVNQRRCEQPGPPANISKIAESVCRYRPADHDLITTSAKLWRMTRDQEAIKAKREAKLGVKMVDGLEVYRAPIVNASCVIEKLLYRGVTILAGRPKSGKSYLVLQFALNVAHGTKAISKYDVLSPGKVLYLALEETQPRTTGRLQRLMTAETPFLQNIKLVYEMQPLFQGGLEQLRNLIDKEAPTLVIIDTFLALVGEVRGDKNPMRAEYKEVSTLQKLAAEFQTTILLVHHTRKASIGETPLDSVAGTTGVTAAADAIWTLRKDQPGEFLLDITGRECEEDSLALKFSADPDCFGWHCTGAGADAKDGKAQADILQFLQHEGAHSVKSIGAAVHVSYSDLRKCLYRLQDQGRVSNDGKLIRIVESRGTYETND